MSALTDFLMKYAGKGLDLVEQHPKATIGGALGLAGAGAGGGVSTWVGAGLGSGEA